MKVCFTGHRRIKKDDLPKISDMLLPKLRELVDANESVDFYAGGALGFDTLSALCVLTLREEYHERIRLHLVLPCVNQTMGWNKADVDAYGYILENADSVTYVEQEYTPDCMRKRNRTLVDGTDLCIAFCNQTSGGTAYTVSYARSKNVPVLNLCEQTA